MLTNPSIGSTDCPIGLAGASVRKTKIASLTYLQGKNWHSPCRPYDSRPTSTE